MPLRAAQLFVRCRSLEELGEALGRALQKIGQRPGERSLLALHEGEWGTLLFDEPDPSLARLLSERFGSALLLHLEGGQLALTVQTWEAGRPGEEERDPRPPDFRDVEAAAWELLRYLGVPPALRLLSLPAVEVLRDQTDAALPALLAQDLELLAVSALPPPREEDALPPAEPDVVVASRAGEARALEVRTLPGGIPTEAWARTLAAVEEAQALRLLRALSLGDEERVPRPTFAYKSRQPVRVEKLLAKARQERPWLARLFDPEREPPLTLAGFTALCRTRLGDLRVVRAHGRNLELESGSRVPDLGHRALHGCVRAPVAKAYLVYLSTLDAEAAAEQLAEETRALVLQAPPPPSAGHLLPTLFAGEPNDRAARPLAKGLCAALLFDDGERISPVCASDLAALGLDFDAALDCALARADALTDAAPEGVRWFDLEHGRVVLCEFPDAGAAGRLLSRHARELVLRVLGEESALAAAPTRDSLLACAASDDEGASWLREEARRRFEEGPFPVHPGLWRIGLDQLTNVAEEDPGPSVEGEGK